MKKNLGVLILLLLSFAISPAQTNDENAKPIKNTAELSWAAQKEHKKWAEQENMIQQARFESDSAIAILRTEVLSKQQAAKDAQVEFDDLKQKYLVAKKLIPKDPWREIFGEKKYVNSANSGFINFSGQIQEVNPTGIRIWGQIGNSKDIEYFVVNFPLKQNVGESVDATKIYSAFQDGDFAYVTEDGFAKKIPKLNYGKSCTAPDNAATIELEAQELTAQEKNRLAPLETEAKIRKEAATAIAARLEERIKAADLANKTALENLKLEKEKAVIADLEQARLGDPKGLRRMGERYRDGDGVERDLPKAEDFFGKAEAALRESAEQTRERARQKEQEALKQKFLRNLILADKNDNVLSMLYISNCYSNGIGTEKDLTKAAEYFQKAVSTGLPKQPNRALY
jgi:hypothetical protein